MARSQGSYDSGAGELSDAAYAFDWLQQVNPTSSNLCWIGGYFLWRFDCYAINDERPEIEGFVSVAPPADSEDFSFLAPCPSSGIIIYMEDDTNVPVRSVKKLASKLDGQKNISVLFQSIKGTDHFFKDKIEELSSAASTYIQERPYER